MTTPRQTVPAFRNSLRYVHEETAKANGSRVSRFLGAVRWFGFNPTTLLYLKLKNARGNHRAADGFLARWLDMLRLNTEEIRYS